MQRASIETPSRRLNLDLLISSGSPELVALAGPRPMLALPIYKMIIVKLEESNSILTCYIQFHLFSGDVLQSPSLTEPNASCAKDRSPGHA